MAAGRKDQEQPDARKVPRDDEAFTDQPASRPERERMRGSGEQPKRPPPVARQPGKLPLPD